MERSFPELWEAPCCFFLRPRFLLSFAVFVLIFVFVPVLRLFFLLFWRFCRRLGHWTIWRSSLTLRIRALGRLGGRWWLRGRTRRGTIHGIRRSLLLLWRCSVPIWDIRRSPIGRRLSRRLSWVATCIRRPRNRFGRIPRVRIIARRRVRLISVRRLGSVRTHAVVRIGRSHIPRIVIPGRLWWICVAARSRNRTIIHVPAVRGRIIAVGSGVPVHICGVSRGSHVIVGNHGVVCAAVRCRRQRRWQLGANLLHTLRVQR